MNANLLLLSSLLSSFDVLDLADNNQDQRFSFRFIQIRMGWGWGWDARVSKSVEGDERVTN
jgi:hypothetical protein